MKVILRKDVEHLGSAGELKSVADGYARNYLIPRELALPSRPGLVEWYERGKEKRTVLREKRLAGLRESGAKLSGVTLTFSRPVNEQGKLFGSVGKSDVAQSLRASGFSLGPSAVRLDSSIKETGEFEVEIRLHPEVSAKIKVSVTARS